MERSRLEIIWKWTKRFLPVAIGAVGGYLYYYYVGCNNGCAITGNPWASTAYGALFGIILTNWKQAKKSNQEG